MAWCVFEPAGGGRFGLEARRDEPGIGIWNTRPHSLHRPIFPPRLSSSVNGLPHFSHPNAIVIGTYRDFL
jgi:hypothetical protein